MALIVLPAGMVMRLPPSILTADTVMVLPSGSRSFSNKLPEAEPSSAAVLTLETVLGASLTAVTVSASEPLLVRAASAPMVTSSVTT